MIALVVLAVVALFLLDAAHRRSQAQVNSLLIAAAADRQREARERWDLNTRITAPEVVRAAPPAPPADAPPLELLQALQVVRQEADHHEPDDEDEDESFLVGTGPGEL